MGHPGRVVSTWPLEEEVRLLTREVSFKFVAEPSIEELKSDLIIGLKRYSNSVRSRARQVERDAQSKVTIITTDDDNPATKLSGLGTNLRPSSGCGLDDNTPVSKEVEAYLYEVQKELLDHLKKWLDKTRGNQKKSPNKSTHFLANRDREKI